MVTEVKANKLWAMVIGFGLALAPVHNRLLTELVTKDGEVGFFLPAFGTAIWLMGSLGYAVYHKLDWGEKKVYIPLVIILLGIGLSGITAETIGGKVAPLLMACSMMALYLAARNLGKDILYPIAIGAGISAAGVIIYGLFNPGVVSGGIVFEGNYDIVVGYVLLGASFFIGKYRWALAGLALVAMLMSGSPEAIFALAVIGIMILWRRDLSYKLAVIIIPIIMLGALYIGLGHGQQLYTYLGKVAMNHGTQEQGLSAIDYRLMIAEKAMNNIKPLGEGYNVTGFYRDIVHNVPLIIIQQLGWSGFAAGLAWLWIAVYCIIKTKWKYAWALMLTLSVWDHYTWTQIGHWFWALAGVSTSSYISNDYIFKGG